MPVLQVANPRNEGTSSNVSSTLFLKVRATADRPRPSSPELDADENIQPAIRQPRKPSPGLAARLKALGFGKDTNSRKKASIATTDSIGRIPEDHLRHLDTVHRASSTRSNITRRGRAWSGSSSRSALPPKIVGDTSTGFSIEDTSGVDDNPTVFFDDDTRTPEVRSRRKSSTGDIDSEQAVVAASEKVEMDHLKYRMPDHTNGNGTKAIPEIRKAHIEREGGSEEYDMPPPPISKDDVSGSSTPADPVEAQSYFNPFGLQRSGSIYTLSRVSFANQLAQLTSLQLPAASSLSSKVSAIPTAHAASRALMGAAEQIRSWIHKASEVLGGLDADDDVEWAAADGREGLAEVDTAITRFEELINVYVSAIEELQNRQDISSVPSGELKNVLTQVETIITEWEKIKKDLTGVKGQVEIAMEWEELWNTVLGDIGNEMDILKKLVFEMEEKRHKSLILEADGVGIDELETIVEETPQIGARMQAKNNNRFSVNAGFPVTPNSPQTPTMAQDDSSLLALFARMQPLRASLDFLPMRLSTFHYRAEATFPTACNELETRREGLESNWKQLEKDAESLRRELGEDRWVIVFRGAGRQAQKMYDSVERSVEKLKEYVDAGSHLNNPSAMGKKIESYETKKIHYGPAIERVLAIIERGVKDRLTVNGEIVRLHSDMQDKWSKLKSEMANLDIVLDDLQADKRNQQLRDSISSLMSNDRSTLGSLDTPGSSPASSVIMSNMNGTLDTPSKNGKRLASKLPAAGKRTLSSSSQLPRKGSTQRLSSFGLGISASTPPGRGSSATPTGNRLPRPSLSGGDGKPRWNSSVKTDPNITGHNFKPLSLTTPSPHAKTGLPLPNSNNRSASYSTPLSSKLPIRRSIGPDIPSSPPSAGENTPSRPAAPRNTSSRLALRDRLASPGPYSQLTMSSPATRPRQLQSQASTGNLASRRASYQPASSTGNNSPARSTTTGRPASSLATSRRTSMLPQPRGRQDTSRKDSSVTGRESPAAIAGAKHAMMRGSSQASTDSKDKDKPKWK